MNPNPLKFHCAPNGTDPFYATEHDFERFVAFGLLASYNHLLGQGCEAFSATEEDVFWLRQNFLSEVENAILAVPDLLAEEGKEAYQKHSCYYHGVNSEGVRIAMVDKTKWREIYFQWRFHRLDKEDEEPSVLLFALDWGEDEFPIWLALDALDDKNKVAAVLAKARLANERPHS